MKCPEDREERRCADLEFKPVVMSTIGASGLHALSSGKVYVLSKLKHELDVVDSQLRVVCKDLMNGPVLQKAFALWDTPENEGVAGMETKVVLADEAPIWRITPYKKQQNLGPLGRVSKEVVCLQQIVNTPTYTTLGQERCCVRKHSNRVASNPDIASDIKTALRTL
jgi:hypothetical protein